MADAEEISALANGWSRPDPGRHPGLAREFERLFVGPGPVPCPPYESYWRPDATGPLRGTLMGPCVTDLLALYRALGLQVRRAAAELPDHVAVELEALSVAAGEAGHPEVLARLYGDHLSVWLPRFCDAVMTETVEDYYRSLANETDRRLAAAIARETTQPVG